MNAYLITYQVTERVCAKNAAEAAEMVLKRLNGTISQSDILDNRLDTENHCGTFESDLAE